MKNSSFEFYNMLKKTIRYGVIGFLAWLGIHNVVIISDGLTNSQSKADYAVVMGNKVNTDGTLSERLSKRLECSLELYRSKQVNGFIVSGGLGKEGFYEGSKMKEFLVQHGVPDSLIVTDNKGDNTLKTVENVIRLKDSLHYHSLIVVSQYYHLTRCKMLFRKNGFEAVSGASPAYFEWRDLYSIVREFFAYYSEAL
jgi:vancomycin permeability regulator SanA